jgi:hypothetical protein
MITTVLLIALAFALGFWTHGFTRRKMVRFALRDKKIYREALTQLNYTALRQLHHSVEEELKERQP